MTTKDILITIGTGVAILFIINWLSTPKPPQAPPGYGFMGSLSIGYDGFDYSRLIKNQ